ncbi:hypothetical protein DMENIID0001_170670 [Sergentomyia squamirostris]
MYSFATDADSDCTDTGTAKSPIASSDLGGWTDNGNSKRNPREYIANRESKYPDIAGEPDCTTVIVQHIHPKEFNSYCVHRRRRHRSRLDPRRSVVKGCEGSSLLFIFGELVRIVEVIARLFLFDFPRNKSLYATGLKFWSLWNGDIGCSAEDLNDEVKERSRG